MSGDYVDILIEDMRLDDPNLKAYDGKSMGSNVPPGTYTFECVDAKRETSKAGNPMITIDFRVVEGDFAGEDIRGWYTLDSTNATSRGRLKQLTTGLGVPILDNGSFSLASMLGLQMIGDVIAEPGKETFDERTNTMIPGKVFAKVVNERPIPSAAPAKAAAPANGKAAAGRTAVGAAQPRGR